MDDDIHWKKREYCWFVTDEIVWGWCWIAKGVEGYWPGVFRIWSGPASTRSGINFMLGADGNANGLVEYLPLKGEKAEKDDLHWSKIVLFRRAGQQ